MARYRDHQDSPLLRILLFLSRSFRIGWLFQVEVRMYLVAAILMPLVFLGWFRPIAATGVELFTLVALAFVSLYVIVWSHEMGHILWARRRHIRTPLITLSPLGGVAHLGSPAPDPRSDLGITLAGPAVHVAWIAVFWPLAHWLPYDLLKIDGWNTRPLGLWLDLLVQTNIALLIFNLLPLFPMDGGRALRALLSMRMHPNRATMIATTIGIAGAVLLAVYGFLGTRVTGTIYVFIAIANVEACLNERRLARVSLIYHGDDPREAWQSDPEAWRRGADPFAHTSGRERTPGPLARFLKRRRAGTKVERTRPGPQPLDLELDRVLDRIHQVGMSALTDQEREILKRASERRRGTG